MTREVSRFNSLIKLVNLYDEVADAGGEYHAIQDVADDDRPLRKQACIHAPINHSERKCGDGDRQCSGHNPQHIHDLKRRDCDSSRRNCGCWGRRGGPRLCWCARRDVIRRGQLGSRQRPFTKDKLTQARSDADLPAHLFPGSRSQNFNHLSFANREMRCMRMAVGDDRTDPRLAKAIRKQITPATPKWDQNWGD